MSAAALLWRQLRFERRLFWRSPSAAFFNFLLPLLFLVLVAAVFAGGDRARLSILVPGIAGMAVMSTTFTALAFNLTFLREQGILKRMRGTPLPTGAYLGGLLGSSVLNAAAQVLIVVGVGHWVYDLDWPGDPLGVVAFTALGVVAFGALGIAFSHVIPSVDSAPAYVNAVFLPVIFISGVFYSSSELPAPLAALAQALPLKHVIDGLAGTIVADVGPLELPVATLAVSAWAVVGVVLAVRSFRWE